jgi:hypothetical protein
MSIINCLCSGGDIMVNGIEVDGQQMSESLDIVPTTQQQAQDMYNPELLKLIEKISSLISDLASTVTDTKSIPVTLKSGISSTLKEVDSSVKQLKDLASSPINESGRIETSGIGDMPIISLESATLYPLTKEVEIEGVKHRLPRAEFVVLYSLAARCGQEVALGKDHSLLTRLSTIRRMLPAIKPKIESVGQGRYILHCKYKNGK